MRFIKKTNYYLEKEARHLMKEPLPLLIACVFPLIAAFFLTYVFSNSSIHDIPVTIVDLDNSALSRLVTRNLDGTQSLKVSKVTSNEEEAKNSLKAGESFAVIYLEKDFEKNVKKGQSSKIDVLANGAMLLYSKVIYRTVAMGVMTISSGIQIRRLEAKGMMPDLARARAVPVRTEIQAFGNPWYDYSFYLVPGIVMAILQMSAAFSTLWVFRRHREDSQAREIPQPGSRLAYLIGKLTPLFLANLITVTVIYTVVFPLAGVPIMNSYYELILLTLLFVFASMGIGAFLSILLKNIVTSMQISLIVNAPAFVFSGYTFPRWAMPHWVSDLANILPLTHFNDGFFAIMIYDNPTMLGVNGLLIIAGVLWGAVLLLITKPGIKLRMFLEPFKLKVKKV